MENALPSIEQSLLSKAYSVSEFISVAVALAKEAGLILKTLHKSHVLNDFK